MEESDARLSPVDRRRSSRCSDRAAAASFHVAASLTYALDLTGLKCEAVSYSFGRQRCDRDRLQIRVLDQAHQMLTLDAGLAGCDIELRVERARCRTRDIADQIRIAALELALRRIHDDARRRFLARRTPLALTLLLAHGVADLAAERRLIWSDEAVVRLAEPQAAHEVVVSVYGGEMDPV